MRLPRRNSPRAPLYGALALAVLGLAVSCADQPGEGSVPVTLVTDLGDIVIELYPDKAPLTVGHFLSHVDGGTYNGASFYRTVRPDTGLREPAIQVIQGGISFMAAANRPSEGSPVAHESTAQTGLRHVDGALSMARGDVGTAATEFFICVGAQPSLDHGGQRHPDEQGFAVFGAVIAGMDVVRAIQSQPVTSDVPANWTPVAGQILARPVVIRSAQRTAAGE